MTERDKVIKGLEKVWDAFNHMEHELYADYVYDALELLEAQKARLLTLDEAKALPYDTDIWIEYLNIFNDPVTYAATICNNTKSLLAHRPADVLYHWYDYEKSFVIWSGRPTEEQQKAVKWDG